MSHIWQKGTTSAVLRGRGHDNDLRDPIADRDEDQAVQAPVVHQDVCGSSMHAFPKRVLQMCYVTHLAGFAVAIPLYLFWLFTSHSLPTPCEEKYL